MGATVKIPQHLDFNRFSNNAHTGSVHIEIAPGSSLIFFDDLPPFSTMISIISSGGEMGTSKGEVGAVGLGGKPTRSLG